MVREGRRSLRLHQTLTKVLEVAKAKITKKRKIEISLGVAPARRLKVFSSSIYDENPDDLATAESEVLFARVPRWLYDEWCSYCKHVARERKSTALRNMMKYHLRLVKEAQRQEDNSNAKIDTERANARARKIKL